jgi:hypothetical protein
MIRAIRTILALGALLPCTALAQSTAPFRVYLSLECTDPALTAQVESYLARELRELGDVTIVDDTQPPNYKIDVIVYKNDDVDLMSLSTVVLRHTDYSFMCGMYSKEDLRNSCKTLIGNMDFYELHYSIVGPQSKLKDACQSIIANFDSKALQKERLSRQNSVSD